MADQLAECVFEDLVGDIETAGVVVAELDLQGSTCQHLVAVEDLVGDTHFRIHIEVGPDGHKMFVAVVSWRLLTETRSLSWL